jgi:hypothetical protein
LGDDIPVAIQHAGKDPSNVASQIDDRVPMTPRTYEITFAGPAVPAIIGAFEDFEVSVDRDTTTLRAELPDQPALHGALNRLQDLGLELLHVNIVEPPS